MTMTENPTNVTEAGCSCGPDGCGQECLTAALSVSGASLKACAMVATHKNTKHRPTLRSVAIGNDLVVATDSYRCIVAHRLPEQLGVSELLELVNGFDPEQALLISGDAITSAKLPSSEVTVSKLAGFVELHAGGNTYRADTLEQEYIKLSGIFPAAGADRLWATGGFAAFNPDYFADLGKHAKALAGGVPAKNTRQTVRIHQADPLKPGLFHLAGTPDTPSALEILMPVRID